MRRRRGGLVDRTERDLMIAVRTLRRRPALTAVAVATFGLGIGANTAMFSVVDAVLLRPLPFAEPDRLVRIWSANPRGISRNSMSPPNFLDLRDQAVAAEALSSAAAFTMGEAMTIRTGEPSRGWRRLKNRHEQRGGSGADRCRRGRRRRQLPAGPPRGGSKSGRFVAG